MIILGIDPGSRITGFGLVSKQGSKITHVDNGIIDVSKNVSFEKKLLKIFEGINNIISTFKPSEVAIENIFYAKNVQSALKLGHARGAAMVAFAMNELPVFEYTPVQVKLAVTGYGKALKPQVMEMTRRLLCLREVPKPDDTADALAIAICHCHASGTALRQFLR